MAADNGRSYIIDRLKSKKTTIDEFNFDKLQAPPLSMFLSPFDIAELRGIATSLKLSGKPKERLSMIDTVLRRRGLVKFGGGTNRVVYRHPEFNDILFKVAIDAVGMGDNPAEFRNQFLLKPFVAKTFEISPCGTVAVVERLKPIINREEYYSVADDVFELLNTWVLGKYVMADIGSKYFMNIGVRKGFGVCIIDYPYLYELDGNKLFCRKPDPTSPSGCCDGVIDYDDGFNYLVCTKCGAKYHAKDLAKEIKNNIIKVDKEEIKMGIRIKGGTNNISKEVKGSNIISSTVEDVTGVNVVKVTPSRPNNTKTFAEKSVNGVPVNSETHKEENKEVEQPRKVVVKRNSSDNSEEELKKTNVNKPNDNYKDVETETEDTMVEAIEPEEVEPEVVEEKVITSPVSFDESLKKDEVEVDRSTPVFNIEKLTEDIVNNINNIQVDQIKLDTIEGIFDKLANSDVDKLQLFKLMIKSAISLYNVTEDEDISVQMLANEDFKDYMSRNYDIYCTTDTDAESSVISINPYLGYSYERDEEEENREHVIDFDPIDINVSFENMTNDTAIDEEDSDIEDGDKKYLGISWYRGIKINTESIIPDNDDPTDVIIPIDDDGNYVTNNQGYIIAIDEIDDHEVKDVSIVSSSWLDNVLAENEKINETPEEVENEIPKKKVTKEVDTKDAPVGALPQTNESVVEAMEEFLENENQE